MWGLSIPATKIGLGTLPPLTLTTLRFAIALPVLFVCSMGRNPVPRRALPSFAGLGVLGVGVGQVAQAFGVDNTTASVGTVISATIPVFIVFFAAIRLGQHISTLQKVGLLSAFAGIAMVGIGDGQGGAAMTNSTLSGAAYLLLSAVTIAFYYVWSVELTKEYGAVAVATWSSLFGFLSRLPWLYWEMCTVPLNFSAQAVWSAIYLGIVVTVAGLFLWLNLLRIVPARIAASVQYLQPIVGVAASAAIFGDKLGPWFFVSVSLVLVGLGLTMTPSKKIA